MKKIVVSNLNCLDDIKKLVGEKIDIPISCLDDYYVLYIPNDKYISVKNYLYKNKSYYLSNKMSSRYPVRRINFAYYDRENINNYFTILKKFLRRPDLHLKLDKEFNNIALLYAEVKDNEDYEMLKKQLEGFEKVFSQMGFGIVELKDIDIDHTETINKELDDEIKAVIQNYLSKSLVNRALNNSWYTSRQHILLDTNPELLDDYKNTYILLANCKKPDKTGDISVHVTCNSIYEGTYIKSVDKYSIGPVSVVEKESPFGDTVLKKQCRDEGDIIQMVKVVDESEIRVDSYLVGNRIGEDLNNNKLRGNLFSGLPNESCSYVLGFREYFVKIKNTDKVLHYSDNNDNFEIFTIVDDSKNILANLDSIGLICIYDSRDIDNETFLGRENRIKNEYPYYEDALKLFKSRKKVKEMVK